MSIYFKIPNYAATYGERLFIVGDISALGSNNRQNAPELKWTRFGWCVQVSLTDVDLQYLASSKCKYQYFTSIREDLMQRVLPSVDILKKNSSIIINDDWSAGCNEPWYTSAMNVLLGQNSSDIMVFQTQQNKEAQVQFRVFAPYVAKGEKIYLVGSHFPPVCKDTQLSADGRWFSSKIYKFEESETLFVSFKFAVQRANGDIVYEKSDRYLDFNDHLQIFNGFLNVDGHVLPRFAGVNIPVFSIKSCDQLGCGEFADLLLMAQFCQKAGLKVIQILPVLDTVCQNDWTDSYPYGAVSAFALHVMYLRIQDVEGCSEKVKKQVAVLQKQLNCGEIQIDYEETVKQKQQLARTIFDDLYVKNATALKASVQQWINKDEATKYWIYGYCAFKALALHFETPEVKKWGVINDVFVNYSFSKLSMKDRRNVVEQIFKNLKLPTDFEQNLLFNAWLQQQLDTQFKTVADKIRSMHIILKGDLPIGINRQSADTWLCQELFNLDYSAGAPPDQFSSTGQNWDFPTYNWQCMKADGDFEWWSKRFQQMARYYDAVRIDHILGWFRIWEIPAGCIKGNGRLGHFSPSSGIRWSDLEKLLEVSKLDKKRFFEPQISIKSLVPDVCSFNDLQILQSLFILHYNQSNDSLQIIKSEKDAELILKNAMKQEKFDQRKMDEFVALLVRLDCNRVVIPDHRNPEEFFHPLLCNLNEVTQTQSFKTLEVEWQEKLVVLFSDYFAHSAQTRDWAQAADEHFQILKKFNLLFVGEDLGTLHSVVYQKMAEYGLLGTRVQRLPSDINKEFWDQDDYPYLCACTPTTHDLPPLRQYWIQDQEAAKVYWEKQFARGGDNYKQPLSADDCFAIIKKHLYSKAMFAMFLFQDLSSISHIFQWKGDLQKEVINQPEIPQFYWRYRMHISMEDLLSDEHLINILMAEMKSSGRI